MFVPLHATSSGGVDPAAIAVGALVGVAVWQVIRWVSTRGSTRSRDDR